MAYIDELKVNEITINIINDPSILGKLYKAKKNDYQTISVDHSSVDDYIKNEWEIFGKPLKTKTRLRKIKSYSKKFEDDIWCQMYELGYKTMNIDENFYLYFNNNEKEKISVIAINDETALIINCKSHETNIKAPSYKNEFELLGLKIDGFKKTLQQIYGRVLKVKYILALRNLRTDLESDDYKKFSSTNSFLMNNNTFNYINSLIKHYKSVAFYQFLALLFKNELISKDKFNIPAIKGEMGKRNYYMFSIEPELLLKMGFILHRTKVNESEFPTYQRLLVPQRLPGITKFIDEGGYFPNSIIINFNNKKHRIQFEPSSKLGDTQSCFGTLKIPNSYGIAYIIDGQHRVYGYANSKFKSSNTIPVVAFEELDTSEQLKIFMDINENQKAVSPNLRLDLEEDLYWNSDRAEYRIKALKSSITKSLSNSQSSPLFEKISVGEDKSILSSKPFYTILSATNLVPTAKGNIFNENSFKYSLYDLENKNHNNEMLVCKKRVFELLCLSYDYVEQNFSKIYNAEKSFILSNRGTYAFIGLIDSINIFLINNEEIQKLSTSDHRFEAIKPYLISLLEYLEDEISEEETHLHLSMLGSGADLKWLRFFQNIINIKHPDYLPIELIDWKERQDEELQNKGRSLGVEIEKKMKTIVLAKMKAIYNNNWELEINSIKRECLNRAEQEKEKNYKDGLGSTEVHWTEMFNINDYKTIIEKYWNKFPEPKSENFKTFEKDFSINIGNGIGGKAKALKWISFFNSYRNLWAHEGTKEKRLNKKEVDFIEKIYNHFYN